MKRYLLTALISFAITPAFAQQATVYLKFKAAKDQKVTVQLPLDGTTFYPNRSEKQFDKDSILTLNLSVDKIANIYVVNSDRRFRFLIEPGKTTIQLDHSKKDTAAINFKGRSEKGQLLINSRKWTFYQSRADAYLGKDSTANGILKLIVLDREKELQPYEQLLQQKQISNAFYEAIKADIMTYYVAVAAHVPIRLYFDSMRDSKVVFKDEFKKLWKEVYNSYSFTNPANYNAAEYYSLAEYYTNYYQDMFLAQANGTWVKPDYSNADLRLKLSYQSFSRNFTGKSREYLMAYFLYNEMLQEKYQLLLVEQFNDFKQQYPKSTYTGFLMPMANKILKYHEDIKKDFTADQILLANYSQINTLDELMTKFKGKTVFVDIWATWCGPCKAEFEYGHDLEKFLKSKNAEMLYISMDNEAVQQQWKDMIKYYKLSGSHIRANDALQKDLMNRLWDGKGYSIPRYLIIKDGKLEEAKALRPSDKQKLYDQIAAYL